MRNEHGTSKEKRRLVRAVFETARALLLPPENRGREVNPWEGAVAREGRRPGRFKIGSSSSKKPLVIPREPQGQDCGDRKAGFGRFGFLERHSQGTPPDSYIADARVDTHGTVKVVVALSAQAKGWLQENVIMLRAARVAPDTYAFGGDQAERVVKGMTDAKLILDR
jgi:hypothetical protein